jgi:hypothetical protein
MKAWIPIWSRHKDKGVLLVVNLQSIGTNLVMAYPGPQK